jgi:hypothetical protein
MHPGAIPSHRLCTLVRHVAPPPAAPRRQSATPHRAGPAEGPALACRAALADRNADHGEPTRSGRAPSGLRRATRLHPQPGRPSARHQPLHAAAPAPLHRDDRAALGHRADPRRRTRTPRSRAPSPYAGIPARSRAVGADAERPSRGRRAYPRPAIGGPKPPPDRGRPQRRPNPDSTRGRAVVAVDRARPPPAGSLTRASVAAVP